LYNTISTKIKDLKKKILALSKNITLNRTHIALFGITAAVIILTVVTFFTFRTLLSKPVQLEKTHIDLKAKPVDILTDQNWKHFAGSTVTPEGVLITALNRIIIHQDGTIGQINSPVNLAGPHLEISGDFKVNVRMEKINHIASFRLYGKPPIIYDQWRFENGSIAIEVGKDSIIARLWDGTSSNSIDMRTFPFTLKNPVNLSIEHRKDTIIISEGKKMLGTIPAHGIFNSNEVWFGADAAVGDAWLLSSLTVNKAVKGKVEIVTPPSFIVKRDDPNTLRNLAAAHPRKLNIGAAIAFGALVTDENYRKIALGEFNMITPENGMKPHFIHPQKDVYSFVETDLLVDIAKQNDMSVHGHTLVYAKSNPQWITDSPKEELQKIMVDHITTIVNHYKGRVVEWDVVNEPLANRLSVFHGARQGLENTIWYEAMGEEYIDIAFKAAHEADPEAILYLNDYGLERDGNRWDAIIGLVERLKARGVPIDGVGFESHIYADGDYSDSAVLRKHMQKLAELGLKVRISEIDVVGDDPEEQSNQYVLALDACLREPNCTGYSTWGITDLLGSTTASDRYPLRYGSSLLFDTDLRPKPAYFALQERLKQRY